MGTFAAILGGIGGLCAVMGIVTALEAIEPITAQLTWMFWFVLAAILMLGAIALQTGSSINDEQDGDTSRDRIQTGARRPAAGKTGIGRLRYIPGPGATR